ncbi:MAG: hypothetical protein AVDCRST_MAG32-1033, partial [uncultured Nocardioides sp.]
EQLLPAPSGRQGGDGSRVRTHGRPHRHYHRRSCGAVRDGRQRPLLRPGRRLRL